MGQRIETRKSKRRSGFENEPADEWREDYARGGPVRSDEPERDYFFEHSMAGRADADADGTSHRVRRQAMRSPALKPIQFGKRSFRGRGPRNYHPSDERMRERICEVLTDDSDIDAENLLVEVESGIVKMEGSVSDVLMKDRLLAMVQDVHGVVGVVEHVQVADATMQ